MERGVWHQCGDKSQILALEQLKVGVGVGVVISPRDLALDGAAGYAKQYRDVGAHVLIDQQFHLPEAMVGKLGSYPTAPYRESVSTLHDMPDEEMAGFTEALRSINDQVGADGIIAPAVVYESGRPDIDELNARMFVAARAAGDALGRPVYATVILGQSAVATDATISAALSNATALDADGWYFGFEFDEERIPSSKEAVLRCCSAALTLACTGKPVLWAYAGPLALLGFGCGVTAVGVGHSQNLWRFDRSRYAPATGQGGGGDAPARRFSRPLWGTIIDPDETLQLSAELQAQVLTNSPYLAGWNRWQAYRHLVHVIGTTVGELAALHNPRGSAKAALGILDGAVELHAKIALKVYLKDGTNSYQANWRDALSELLAVRSKDYDFLALLG